jgi:hypothetical protein
MSALSWDTANHLTVPSLDQDCQEELTSGPRTLPNGQRISGERRAEGDERVRCMRVLGSVADSQRAAARLPFKPAPPKRLSSSLPKAPPFRLFACCQGGP